MSVDLNGATMQHWTYYDSKLDRIVFECDAINSLFADVLFREETGASYHAVKLVFRQPPIPITKANPK